MTSSDILYALVLSACYVTYKKTSLHWFFNELQYKLFISTYLDFWYKKRRTGMCSAWEISGIGIPGTWRFRFWKVTACDNFKGIPKWALTDNICNTKFLLLYCSKTKSMIPAYRKFRNKGMTEKLIQSIYQYWIQWRYFFIYRMGIPNNPGVIVQWLSYFTCASASWISTLNAEP